jgi:hypothetical protein
MNVAAFSDVFENSLRVPDGPANSCTPIACDHVDSS